MVVQVKYSTLTVLIFIMRVAVAVVQFTGHLVQQVVQGVKVVVVMVTPVVLETIQQVQQIQVVVAVVH
jgi:hypothetical protein